MSLLIEHATTLSLTPRDVREAYILIEDDEIKSVTEQRPEGQYETFDAGGRVVMPGNVCAHTHIYSALARGMPAPPRNPRNFREILELIWWRLDRALDEESIRSSAAIGAIDALRSGTTTLIDHHASPECIDGSLDILASEMTQVGVRGVLCYEVTDRNGEEGRNSGIRENRRFAEEVKDRWPTMRALFGAHASFTLNDESLEAISGEAADLGIGVHIHAAEDECDELDSLQRSGSRVAFRLDGHGIVGTKTLLAHGVHFDSSETSLIQRQGAWVAHNCRSNLNNSVGRAPVMEFLRSLGDHVVLGTDGIDEDMFSESRSAYFRLREDSLDAYSEQVTDMLSSGGRLASQSFGRPIGALQAGSCADLLVLDYVPPTPLTSENLAWHWTFAFGAQMVRDVMVGGKWVVMDRAVLNVDEEALRAEARHQAEKLWSRMQDLA